jgi:hypothetical protein
VAARIDSAFALFRCCAARRNGSDECHHQQPLETDHAAAAQPAGLKTRSLDAGYFASLAAGRRGRTLNSPPQFGHTPCSTLVTQSAQKVHSKVQMRACVDSGGRSTLQHSQLGRS